MTYFRTGGPYYHRRAAVSRSCSGWEGVGPAGYGRQALAGNRGQLTGNRGSGVLHGRASSADARAVSHRSVKTSEREWQGLGWLYWREVRDDAGFICYLSPVTSSLTRTAHCYGVKPHGPLVPVSSTRYRASTPGLSTWWSATTLQGGQASGRSHLQARFPLRCFQRLSLPYIATRRCDWRHNRYTSGTSTPVLSY